MKGGDHRKILYVYRGGLKHFEAFSSRGGEWAVYDPKTEKMLKGKINSGEPVVIVDDDIVSGSSILKVINDLKLEEYEIAGWSPSSFSPDVELDYPLSVGKPIIAFLGLPAVGKSFLAVSLSQALGVPRYKWGDFVRESGDYGNYGELLMEREKDDPFIVAEICYRRLVRDTGTLILDGVKTEHQITFVGFALRRPVIPIYVECPDEARRFFFTVRGHSDDRYWKERDTLFTGFLGGMRKKSSVVRINSNDHSKTIAFLGYHGIRFGRGFYPQTLFYKPTITSWLRRISLSSHEVSPDDCDGLLLLPDHYASHYGERYGAKIKDARRKDIAVRLSIAYRLVDDILDEHDTRNGHETLHVERSVFDALFTAGILVLNAKSLMTGEEREWFREMTETVYNAVMTELEFEIHPDRVPTEGDYFKTLEREAGFRKFVYRLANLNPNDGWMAGIRSQMKDDLFGSEKYNRESTEARLNRPARYSRRFAESDMRVRV